MIADLRRGARPCRSPTSRSGSAARSRPSTFGFAVWSAKIAQVAAILPYLLLVLILIFRPKGLFGTREG